MRLMSLMEAKEGGKDDGVIFGRELLITHWKNHVVVVTNSR